MADLEPLSIESAMELLHTEPATSESPADGAAPSNEDDKDKNTQPAKDAAEETPTASGEKPAEGETQDTPEGNTGETNDEGGEQGDALPPIEAPSSWNAEEKAVWESLPRAAQEAISRREQDRTTELRNIQNKSADQRKSTDAEFARLKGLSDRINGLVDDKVAAMAKDFPEIKSEADIAALANSDPARFAAFQGRLMELQAATAIKAQKDNELRQRAESEHQESMARAKDALIEAFPTWKDATVARQEITALQEYAIKQGVPEAAARANLDPYVFKFVQKAMLYDRAQAKAKEALNKTPPRVVKPGTQPTNPKQAAKDEARSAQLRKLDQTGDLEDALGLLRG